MSRTVLIVEDESIIADDLRHTVTALGFIFVGRAATGTDAIQKARELQPGIILMDVRLRGPMSGRTAAEEICRERPTPIVFLSAFAPAQELGRGQAFVPKPFTRGQLLQAMENAAAEHEISSR